LTKTVAKIPDIIIRMESRFALEKLSKEEERLQIQERFKNFFYNGKENPTL